MTKDEFHALNTGDRFTHPWFIGFLEVRDCYLAWRGPEGEETEQTIAVLTTTGHIIKEDDPALEDMRLLPNPSPKEKPHD